MSNRSAIYPAAAQRCLPALSLSPGPGWHRLPKRSQLALAACVALGAAGAQAQAQTLPQTQTQTQTVLITGNPLGRDGAGLPASVLTGPGLQLRRAGTLGETLDGLPGVSASSFGPNSSRPVIRGLDGDRVRLLDNGGASVDASSLSFDHASATNPLATERIEVLRGPAALLYGGNATGGVVNSIDNRIPRAPVSASGVVSGRAEVRAGGVANERAGAVLLEGGSGHPAGGIAWHVDAYGQQSDDLKVPRYTPVEGGADGSPLDPSQRVRNSASRASGGAVGASWAAQDGFIGASLESSRNRYGVTVEPDVTIRMERERAALAGEWRKLPGFLSWMTQVSGQYSHSRYQHQEVEGSGEVGTTFKSRGDEARLQAQHAPIGGLRGVFGLQAESLDFEALGAEAFVPATQTRSQAAFLLETLTLGPVDLTAGARLERVSVKSAGDAPSAEEARFGAASERRFTPKSLSLGARWGGPQGWLASASLGHTERAPAYYELFANGVHVATAAYERGDAQLGTERSAHAEVGLAYTRGAHSVKANGFQTRFSRFISLDATGETFEEAGADGEAASSVPVYAFRAVRARLQGFEIEARTRLLEGPLTLDLNGQLDRVRGDNLDAREPLPRLAPQRVRLGLEAAYQQLRAGLVWRHSAKQDRVPATDTATPGYQMLDLWVSGRVDIGADSSWFARLNNVTNELAYNASSIVTMRGLAPLPGRALTVGLRSRF